MTENTQVQPTNWRQIIITAVLTGIITFVVTIVSSQILFVTQSKIPRLYYMPSKTIPFLGKNQTIGIYQVSIGNEGSKVAREVICVVQITDAYIREWRIYADPAFDYSSLVSNDTLRLDFPMINPSELIQLSILANATLSLPEKPIVSIRAEDVTGVEKTMSETPKQFPVDVYINTITAITVTCVASIVFYLSLRKERKRV